MPHANLLAATGDCIIAAQTRFQANNLKAKSALFASQVQSAVSERTGAPIINWCVVIASASAKMVSASGTLLEANTMGLLLYRCLALADALPVGGAGGLTAPEKTAILTAYNTHLSSV